MNLQEFIQQTLIQVAQASKNVSEEMQSKGLGDGVKDNDNIKVSFDIAVTAISENSKGLSAGIKVVDIGILGGKTNNAKTENASRIKLDLPLKVIGANTKSYIKP